MIYLEKLVDIKEPFQPTYSDLQNFIESQCLFTVFAVYESLERKDLKCRRIYLHEINLNYPKRRRLIWWPAVNLEVVLHSA